MRRAGLQKVRLKERRDIGAAVTIAQRLTFGQKRRFDHAPAASGLAQQPDILRVPRHVSKVQTCDTKEAGCLTRGFQSRQPNSSGRFHGF
jgi:hypothetical protein